MEALWCAAPWTRTAKTVSDTIRSKVSDKTTCLRAGEEAGSKLDKATTFGAKMLSEAEFLSMF